MLEQYMNILNIDSPGKKWQPYLYFCFAMILSGVAIGATFIAGWWSKSVWGNDFSSASFLKFIGIAFLFCIICLRFKVPLLLAILPAIFIHIGIVGIGAFATVLWLWLCAISIGRYITLLTGENTDSWLTVRNGALGFVAMGGVISVAAHFTVNTPTIYFGAISSLAIFCYWHAYTKNGVCKISLDAFKTCKREWPEIILMSFVLIGTLLILILSTLPDVGHDALSMHLNIPARMLEAGRWDFDASQYIWSVMPMGANWLTVPAYFLAGEEGARLLNASFLLATAWLMYQMLILRSAQIAALTGPAILLTLPLTFSLASTAFVEPALGFFFMVCLAELAGSKEAKVGRWFVIAVAAGYACSIKLMGWPILPFYLASMIIRSRSRKFEPATLRVVLIAVLAFIVCALPPYLVAYWKTGNPILPYYNDIFRSPFFTTASVFGNGYGLANPLYTNLLNSSIFWDSTFGSRIFGEFRSNGVIGIAFFIILPLSLLVTSISRRWWALATLIAALLYILLIFRTQAYLRYIFQVIPWILVVGAWALSRLFSARISVLLLVSTICIVNLLRFPVGMWPLEQFTTRLFFDRAIRDEFLAVNQPQAVIGNILQKMDGAKHQKILIMGRDPVFSHFPAGTLADSWHSPKYYYSPLKNTAFTKLLAQLGVDIIVHTIGEGELHESEIINVTNELFRFHTIRVARVKPELLYTQELILGTDLRKPAVAWKLNGAAITATGLSSTVSKSATQLVDFSAYDKGWLQMKVACPAGQLFRSQINWSGERDNFIATDIEVHSCNPDGAVISRTILRPVGAVFAMIYTGGHTEQAVTTEMVSLRVAS